MKQKLFTIALAFTSVLAVAQITVTDADLVNIGDVIYQASDSLPANSITVGNAGANQTWDFSALQVLEYDTTEFIDPAGTPFASFHPSANLCIEEDGQFVYIEKSSASLSVVGFDALPYSFLVTPLPIVYGNTVNIPSSVVMDSVMPNMFFPDTLAPLLTLGLAHTIDSIRITMAVGSDVTVDAYGNVTIPMGIFDALRVNNTTTTISEYSVYCTDTMFNMNSGWFSAAALLPNETDVQNSYQWWTNDVNAKFILVQMDVDDYGDINGVEFMHSPVPASVANLSASNFNIYPIPATNNLTVDAKDNELTDLILVDVSGKIILNKEFMQTTSLDLSGYAKGIYYLKLKTVSGELTKKVILE